VLEAPLHTVYVSYDGALDPLGGSQVLPYLERLALCNVKPTLLSFEKPERFCQDDTRRRVAERLAQAGVAWQPLRYHKSPRVPATFFDVLRGAAALRALVRSSGARLVHCRGEIATAMARLARLPRAVKLVYEARGLFADERVEIGSWPAGGLVDRAVRRLEAANLRAADGLLCVMASAGLEALRQRRDPLPPYRELPNSVDLEAFRPRPSGQTAEYGLAYSGSLGGWYLTREMVAFARASVGLVPGRPLFLTPQLQEARQAGVTDDWAELRSVPPEQVPGWLARATATFFFIQESPSKRASSPTKFAESLACGLPVAANGASGDLDRILEHERVGVLVDVREPASFERQVRRLAALAADPRTAAACRELAERRYSLSAAVAAYHQLYRELVRS